MKDSCIIKNASLLISIIFIVIIWFYKGNPELNKIAVYVSGNVGASLLCCAALSIFKCFASFFPTTLIYATCGYLLSTEYAILACLFTNALIFTVSFFISRKEINKREKMEIKAIDTFLYSLTLHSIRIIPANAAGSVLGKGSAPYLSGLAGALLGKLPVIILTLSLTTLE